MIGVVLLHNQYTSWGTLQNSPSATLLELLEQVVSFGIMPVCVPLFFMISGFLLLQGDAHSRQGIVRKWKNRWRTLVVPYLLWNALIFCAFLTLHRANVADLSSALWNFQDTKMPVHFQFWFLRDLILLTLTYPLWAWIIRTTRGYFTVLLAGVCILCPSVQELFYFALGMTLTAHSAWLERTSRSVQTAVALLFIALVALRTLCHYEWLPLQWHADLAIILTGAFTFWHLMRQLSATSNGYMAMGKYAFFLYAFHEPLFSMMRKAALPYLSQHLAAATSLYLLLPMATVAVTIAIYHLLSRCLPGVLSLLVGGHKSPSS